MARYAEIAHIVERVQARSDVPEDYLSTPEVSKRLSCTRVTSLQLVKDRLLSAIVVGVGRGGERYFFDPRRVNRLKRQLGQNVGVLTVPTVARKAEVTENTIYGWIKNGVNGAGGKISRLKARERVVRIKYPNGQRIMRALTVTPDDYEAFVPWVLSLRQSHGITLQSGEIVLATVPSEFPNLTRSQYWFWCVRGCGYMGGAKPWFRREWSIVNGKEIYIVRRHDAQYLSQKVENDSGVFLINGETWVTVKSAVDRNNSPEYQLTKGSVRGGIRSKAVRSQRINEHVYKKGGTASGLLVLLESDLRLWGFARQLLKRILDGDRPSEGALFEMLNSMNGQANKQPHELERLTLDFSSNRVLTRPGHGCVDFGAKQLLWRLAEHLYDAGESYRSTKDLDRNVWNLDDQGSVPEVSTIRSAVRSLRKILSPIGVTVKNQKRLGWRLAPTC